MLYTRQDQHKHHREKLQSGGGGNLRGPKTYLFLENSTAMMYLSFKYDILRVQKYGYNLPKGKHILRIQSRPAASEAELPFTEATGRVIQGLGFRVLGF